MRLEPLLVCSLGLLLALQSTLPAQALTTTTFDYRGQTLEEAVLELEGGGEPRLVNLTFPAELPDQVSLSYGVTGHMAGYPGDLEIRVPDQDRWLASHPYDDPLGGGLLGRRTEFWPHDPTTVLELDDNWSRESFEVSLPANATIETASMTLEGLPAVDGRWHPSQRLSVPTNGGSLSRTPRLAVGPTGTLHLLWADRAEHPAYLDRYDLLYRRFMEGQWGPVQLLATFKHPDPQMTLAVEGAEVVVVWVDREGQASGALTLVRSDNAGQNWSAPSVLLEGRTYQAAWPALRMEAGELFLAFQDEGDTDGDGLADKDILFSSSGDLGTNWSDPLVLSGGVEDGSSMNPALALEESNLTVAWVETGDHDGDGDNEANLVSRSSPDRGGNWSSLRFIDDHDEAAARPSLRTGRAGQLSAAWYRYNSSSREAQLFFSRSDNLGVTWENPSRISRAPVEGTRDAPALVGDGQGNLALAWSTTAPGSLSPGIRLRLSSDNGSSFQAELFVNLTGPSRLRESPALSFDQGGELAVTWVDAGSISYTPGNWSGTDPDIWFRTRDRQTEVWSEAYPLSNQFYRADAAQVQLAWGPEGTAYGIFHDAGDLTGNGDAFSLQGGNLFFVSRQAGQSRWSRPRVITSLGQDELLGEKAWEAARLVVDERGELQVLFLTRTRARDRWELQLVSSPDQGWNWSSPRTVLTNPGPVSHPRLVAGGGLLHLAWKAQNGSRTGLYYSRSFDGGLNWEAPRQLQEGSFSKVLLDSKGRDVVLGLLRQGVPFFLRSTDGGQTFQDLEPAWSYAPTAQDLAMTLHHGDIRFAWTQTSPQGVCSLNFSGFEGGGELTQYPALTLQNLSTPIYYPTLVSSPGVMFLSYVALNRSTGQFELYLITVDESRGGSTGPTLMSGLPDQEGLLPSGPASLAIGRQLMIGWQDRQTDEQGSHYQIWATTSNWTSYPSDITISSPVSQSIFWSWEGALEPGRAPVWDETLHRTNESLVDALREALNEADLGVDGQGLEVGRLKLEAQGRTPGRLVLRELNLTYSITFTLENGSLLETLREAALEARARGDEEAQVRLELSSGYPGSLWVGGLRLVTPHADLALTPRPMVNRTQVGQAVDLALRLENGGTGPSEARLEYWYGPERDTPANLTNRLGWWNGSLQAGGEQNLSLPWRPLKAGTFWLHAAVTSRSPRDLSVGNDQVAVRLEVTPGRVDPPNDQTLLEIGGWETGGPLIEGRLVNLTLELFDPSYQDLTVLQFRVYNGPSLLGQWPLLELASGEALNLTFPWQLTSRDDLTLTWYEAGNPEQRSGRVEVEVLALPAFTGLELEVQTRGEGPSGVISNNTSVAFNGGARYTGDIAVRARESLRLRDPTGRPVAESLGLSSFEPGDSSLASLLHTFSGPGGGPPVYGTYQLEYHLWNITAKQTNLTGLWSAELNITYHRTFQVTPPPRIGLSGLKLDTGPAQGHVLVEFELNNTGGSRAEVYLLLLVYRDGSDPGSPETQSIPLDYENLGVNESRKVRYDYLVSGGKGREHTFEVRLLRVLPAEDPGAGGDQRLVRTGLALGERDRVDPGALTSIMLIMGSIIFIVFFCLTLMMMVQRLKRPTLWGVMEAGQDGDPEPPPVPERLEPIRESAVGSAPGMVEQAPEPPPPEGDDSGSAGSISDRTPVGEGALNGSEPEEALPVGMAGWTTSPADPGPGEAPAGDPEGGVEEPWPSLKELGPSASPPTAPPTPASSGVPADTPRPGQPRRESIPLPRAGAESAMLEPVMVQCPRCDLRQLVKETSRPLHLRCGNCGHQMDLEA